MAFIPYYIGILAVTILIDYYAGIEIEKNSQNKKKQKLWLILSIVSTCLILFVFKYFNFFSENITALAQFLNWNYSLATLQLILPIGLSFHTFQSLSYVIEVYRGKQKAERHFGIYSLYVMFYPQLVAGPIERPQNLLHQFYERHTSDRRRISEGLQRILLGLFKKVVIADNLAIYVNQVYGSPEHYSGLTLITASLFFTFQIYCDFSGYSDIALGAAKVMGFKLMDNFKNPYLSKTISEFWRRWHISLSTWFKDYIYIPLGGSKRGALIWSRNILIVFIVSGFWHGANWTYVIWGAVHALYIIGERFITLCKKQIVLPQFIQTIVTFLLVAIAWVFFRANSAHEAFYIIKTSLQSVYNLSIHPSTFFQFINGWLEPLAYDRQQFVLILIFILFLVIIEIIDCRRGIFLYLESLKPYTRIIIYTVLILAIMNLGVTREVPFIYFQF